MSVTHHNLLYVYYHGAQTKQLMGRLLYKNRQLFFEYDEAFIKGGLELSPFKLPLKPGVILSKDFTFKGLFGVFNDSLPDGWGHLLLDRKLMQLGINPHALSPIDRLCFVGSSGMGALSYEPEYPGGHEHLISDLDRINHEIQLTQKENDEYLDHLLKLGGSSSGARPKVLLHIDNSDWLIKFKSNLDPQDISAIEYTYHLMALESGIQVPEAKIFSSKKEFGFFGVRRFDRQSQKRTHMHTISGLLHADHREPSLDYETIMKATLYLTRDVRECETQFRNTVFNVLSHNRDDHSKNFSLLMSDNGAWQVSPAYDLTFSTGPAGEHATMIMGEGKNPKKEHLLKLAAIANIKEQRALEIVQQVYEGITKWHILAKNTGVTAQQIKLIGDTLQRLGQAIMR